METLPINPGGPIWPEGPNGVTPPGFLSYADRRMDHKIPLFPPLNRLQIGAYPLKIGSPEDVLRQIGEIASSGSPVNERISFTRQGILLAQAYPTFGTINDAALEEHPLAEILRMLRQE